MSVFQFQDGILHAEKVPLPEIARLYGTPVYIYSRQSIESNWLAFDQAYRDRSHLICYAVKANSNIAVLNLLARLGSGFDIVSMGELYRVIKAGGDPKKVVFSGVGKREDEMAYALDQKIKCFNVESANELVRLNKIASEKGMVAAISLRVNPDVDANTHPYISTGLRENKFGIAFETAKSVYQQAASMSNIQIVGIDCHIGSQITKLSPFKDALIKVMELVSELKQIGIELQHIDIGGGLGIQYNEETPPSAEAYVEVVTEVVEDKYEIIMEPGRSIVGNAGVLLTTVEYLNTTPYHNFAVVDGAMNDLIRPALYQGWHTIKNVNQNSDAETKIYDVVGPVCETGDFLGKNRELKVCPGDLLAVHSAGAYGFTMASNYNSRPRVAEVMVDKNMVFEVRKRETLESLIAEEVCIPT